MSDHSGEIMGVARALLPVVFAAGCSSAAASEQPKVGDIVSARVGQSVSGWHIQGGGLGIDDQTYALFRRGDSYIVALTVPVTRDPKGGIRSEKVTKTASTKTLQGEVVLEGIDCGWETLGRDGAPVLAFYNAQSRMARGYFAARDRIITARWPSRPEDCQYHGD